MPGTRFEAGVVAEDNHTHAVTRTIQGPVALCGIGSITRVTPGRFDSGDPLACADCAAQVDGSEPS